jgi:dCTP deaminase
MILSSKEIREEMHRGKIVIQPFAESQLNPNSYNLRLDAQLLTYDTENHYTRNDREGVDLAYPCRTVAHKIPDRGYWLEPGRLYLGSTQEYTETHGLVPCIEGRSSIGRAGVAIHVTAGFGDIGFRGRWTLEITVVHPVKIYHGMEICQICYFRTGDFDRSYGGKYINQTGPLPSKIWQEVQKLPHVANVKPN